MWFMQIEFGNEEALQTLSHLRKVLANREKAPHFEKVIQAGVLDKLVTLLQGPYAFDLQQESLFTI